MNRALLLFLLFVCPSSLEAQTRVYLFPGLGSDERIFEKINLDSSYIPVHIVYPVPSKHANMQAYAKTLLPQIDTSSHFIFIGVSIGGMICTELSDLLTPDKVILLSSAKCRKELPFRYRFQKTIPLNKITPKGLMKLGAKILQPVVEPDRNKNKATFKDMLRKKNKTYLKRSVNMIVNWNRKEYKPSIIHIHGTNDHTLPVRLIKATHLIDGGSHMMTLTRGNEVNLIIRSILSQK